VEVSPPWADRSSDVSGLSPPASLLKSVAAAAQRRANVTSASGKENRSGAHIRQPSGKENVQVNVNLRRENSQTHQRTQSKGFVAPSKLPSLIQPFKRQSLLWYRFDPLYAN